MISLLASAGAPLDLQHGLRLPHITYLSILPILVLLGGAVAILALSSLVRRPLETVWATSLTVATASVAVVVSLFQWYDVADHGAKTAVAGAVAEDGFSALFAVLVSCAVFVSALAGDGWLRREGDHGVEYHVLMLVSASGAVTMAAANDLIVVFLGLEILSIALYVLAAFNRRRAESGEAALKYFVLGSFSSAVFVYGIALVYGATGTSDIPQIADYLARNVLLHDGLLLAGMALLVVGFGFKIAAVPFHLWTPDVYQGAPSPVTGFMAAVAKAGGFAAFIRVFVSSFGLVRTDWQPAVWVLAALTLAVGALVAVVQRDIKRMMAYSSINHAGFILLGLQAATRRGVEGSLYYLFVYSFLVIGSFAVITVVGGRGDGRHDLEHYRDLARRQPWLAAALATFLVAQAGAPFTTGFWAKFEVVAASVGAHATALAVIAMVTAAIAAFFYLRVIVLMYSPAGRPAADPVLSSQPDAAGEEALALAAAAVDRRLEALRGGPGAAVAGGGATGGVPALAGAAAVPQAPAPASGTTAGTPEAPAPDDLAVPATTATAIAICLGVTVLFGIWPGPLTDLAHHATLLLLGR